MKLYSVHDDPEHLCQSDERWWLLVWADCEEDAKLLAASQFREAKPNRSWREFFEAMEVELNEVLLQSMPDFPHIERNNAIMRLARWQEDGELRCDTCGLAACGLRQFEVCPECGQCPECGCDCDKESQ